MEKALSSTELMVAVGAWVTGRVDVNEFAAANGADKVAGFAAIVSSLVDRGLLEKEGNNIFGRGPGLAVYIGHLLKVPLPRLVQRWVCEDGKEGEFKEFPASSRAGVQGDRATFNDGRGGAVSSTPQPSLHIPVGPAGPKGAGVSCGGKGGDELLPREVLGRVRDGDKPERVKADVEIRAGTPSELRQADARMTRVMEISEAIKREIERRPARGIRITAPALAALKRQVRTNGGNPFRGIGRMERRKRHGLKRALTALVKRGFLTPNWCPTPVGRYAAEHARVR